jgi:polyvinyl alcohol dehydrogenase (cytochrome)
MAASLPASAGATAPTDAAPGSGWYSAGHDLADTHSNPAERRVGPADVASLAPRWTFTTGGSVSAIPTVAHGTVYAPDWAGNLWAVDAGTGPAVWNRKIGDYTAEPGDISRVSPAYWAGELVLGDNSQVSSATAGADMFAVDAATGARRWLTKVDADPFAIITGSPVIADGVVYVGVSSRTETTDDTNPTFRGSVVALDAATGRLLWKTYMVPVGYNGGAVWGSSPVVDRETGMLYVGTGNNYSTPPGMCDMPDQTGCTPPDPADHIDSIVALNLRTGALTWSRPTLTADTWTVAERYGPDFDFGASPNLFTTAISGHRRTLLGIGQKSGVYWALDPATGAIVWDTAVGPGSPIGGIEWGAAVDGQRIYVEIGNWSQIPYTLQGTGPYAGQTVTGGSWAALDPATGRVLWQTPDPGSFIDIGALSVANGLVYAGSLAASGPNMYALDAATGTVRWSFASGGAVISAPAVVDGTVYWGSGYRTQGFPPPLGYYGDNDKLYAFSLPSGEH